MFRVSRDRSDEPDRFLDLKIALLLAGAVFGIMGMVRDNKTLIIIAMVIVAAGILLRFLRPRAREDSTPENGSNRGT